MAKPRTNPDATVIASLKALAHTRRLAVLRLVVAAPGGVPFAVLMRRLGLADSTLSTYVGVLERAGLARRRQEADRTVVVEADAAGIGRVAAMVAGLRPGGRGRR